ncbi:AIPR family protein [Bacteroides sp.]|uniref:AIPR family protein n=1 Tax=Bacteroides sp. TaxID=29523 RepID=UPI0025BD0489|nr:AIPR family protein [Bacteroides sp.]
MVQTFDIGLNAKINEFTQNNGIERTEENNPDIFENFGNYIIASNMLEEELDDIKSVSTNKAQGIDGIIIIVNNRLVSEEADLSKFGATESIKISIGFIQATIQKSFSEEKLSAFTDEVVKFLTGEILIEPFSSIYKKLLDDDGDYINRIEETPHVSLHFLSARTSHTIPEEKIVIEKNKIMGRDLIKNKCIVEKFVILQTEEIKIEYDKIPKYHSVQLQFKHNIQLTPVDNIELSLLATIEFSELCKLILTSDNNLKEKLFVENVRNFIGNTPVNNDIKRTLDNESNKCYFPYLNNGLAIICDKIERHPVMPNTFYLTFPRIINGCQTTNILYKKYKEDKDSLQNVEIVAKIISTNDNNLKKDIIYAANNQNSISKDLQSLNDYHQKIELYFEGKDEKNYHLHFERLRGQYSYVTPPYSKVNIETLSRLYISVFLRKPHEMKSNALSVIEQMQKEGKVFNNETEVEKYYYCAVLWYWFNHFLINDVFSMKSKTMDMHIIMACDLILEKKNASSSTDKLTMLTDENKAKSLFIETVNKLNNCSYLFERRGLYSNPKTLKLIEDIKNGTN